MLYDDDGIDKTTVEQYVLCTCNIFTDQFSVEIKYRYIMSERSYTGWSCSNESNPFKEGRNVQVFICTVAKY